MIAIGGKISFKLQWSMEKRYMKQMLPLYVTKICNFAMIKALKEEFQFAL